MKKACSERLNRILKWLSYQYRDICYPTLYTVLVVLAAIYSMRVLSFKVDMVERALVYALCYISAQKISFIKEELSGVFAHTASKVVIVIMSLMITFMMIGVCYIEPGYEFSSGLMLYFLTWFWTFPVLIFMIIQFKRVSLYSEAFGKWRWNRRIQLGLTAILIIYYLIYLYAFNPAITSPDSAWCHYTAFHLGERVIADSHPGFYIWILSLLVRINPSITFVIVVQCFFFASVFVKGIRVLAQSGMPFSICLLVYVFVGMGYNTALLLLSLWKDVPYTIAIMWMTILLIELALDRGVTEKWRFYVELYTSCLLTGLVRHNGVLPVAASLVLLVVFVKQKQKIIVTIMMVLVSWILIKGPLYNMLNINKEIYTGMRICAMTNDVLGVYYEGCELPEETVTFVNTITSGSPESYDYDSFWALPVPDSLYRNYSIPEFAKIYIDTFFKHPKALTLQLLRRTSSLWNLVIANGERGTGTAYTDNYRIETLYPELTLGVESYPVRKDNHMTVFMSRLIAKFTWESEFGSLARLLFWRAAFYNFLIISGCLGIFAWFGKTKTKLLLPFVPIVMQVVSLIIGSAWSDYRYSWSSFVNSIFLTVYTLKIFGSNDLKNDKCI